MRSLVFGTALFGGLYCAFLATAAIKVAVMWRVAPVEMLTFGVHP